LLHQLNEALGTLHSCPGEIRPRIDFNGGRADKSERQRSGDGRHTAPPNVMIPASTGSMPVSANHSALCPFAEKHAALGENASESVNLLLSHILNQLFNNGTTGKTFPGLTRPPSARDTGRGTEPTPLGGTRP
jgi:hypothetical protein